MPEELTELVATPITKEQDKAVPEMAASTSAIDAKQRAASISIDFLGGTATLNVVEGEEKDGTFIPVAHPQKPVDLAAVAGAIANTAKADVMGKLAQFVLDGVTK